MTPIIQKIQKLLALSKSDNINESATAAALAQKLMAEHQIDDAMLATSPEQEEPVQAFEDPLDTKGRQIWRRHLARAICTTNDCGYYVTGDASFGKSYDIRIYGRAGAVQTVRYLYAWLCREVERLANSRRGEGTTWLNEYKKGCVDTIARKLHEAKLEARVEATTAGKGAALVRVDRNAAAIEAFGREKLRLVILKPSRIRSNPNARDRGRQDAQSISMATGPGLGAGTKGSLR